MLTWMVAVVVLGNTDRFTVDGGLAQEEVRRVVEFHQPAFNACLATLKPGAKVRYAFDVDAHGAVKALRFIEAPKTPPARVTCVGAALEAVHFPARDGGTTATWDFFVDASVDAGVPGEAEDVAPQDLAAWDNDVLGCSPSGAPSLQALELEQLVSEEGWVLEQNPGASVSPDVATCLTQRGWRWTWPRAPTVRRLTLRWIVAETDRQASKLFDPKAPARVLLREPLKDGVTVPSGLERDAIMKVIRENQRHMRGCYELALTQHRGLSGKASMAWKVGADGSVIDVSVVEDSIGTEVSDCLAREIRRWKFPRPAGGGVVDVSFAWIFKPAGE